MRTPSAFCTSRTLPPAPDSSVKLSVNLVAVMPFADCWAKARVASAPPTTAPKNCRRFVVGNMGRILLRMQEFCQLRELPSSAEEGWTRHKNKPRSDLIGADGVVLIKKSWPAPPRLREMW